MDQNTHHKSSWPTAVVAIVGLILAAGVAIYLVQSVKDPINTVGKTAKDWVETIGNKISDFFGKKVFVEGTSWTLNKEDIAELAVLQRRSACFTTHKTTRAGSTAIIIVKGIFTIKAGYDLKEGYEVTFDAEKKIVHLKLPQPRILSNTTESQEIYYENSGVTKWNGTKELADAYAANLADSKVEAEALGFLEEAKTRIKERWGDLFPKGTEVHVTFLEPKAIQTAIKL